MGHYWSEMRGEETPEEKKQRENHEKLMREGAQALKEVFGDKAAAVAYFLHNASHPFAERPHAASFEETVNRALKTYTTRPKPPKA